MTGTTKAGDGLTRRTMIRRSALVGGSLVWAAPAVQTLGSTAFAQTTDGSPEPAGEEGPSNVALILLCDGVYYQVKYEFGVNGDSDCGPNADPPPPAGAREEWNQMTAHYDIVDECPPDVVGVSTDSSICVTMPDDCSVELWGVFDGGGRDGHVFFHTGDPVPPGYSVTEDPTTNTICFSKSF